MCDLLDFHVSALLHSSVGSRRCHILTHTPAPTHAATLRSAVYLLLRM